MLIKLFAYFLFVMQMPPCLIANSSRFSSMFSDKHQIPNPDQLMINVLDQSTDIIQKKYGVKGIGFGVRGPQKITGVTLEFQVHRRIRRDEARVMLVDCVQILLENINSNCKLKNEFIRLPFTRRDISVTFYIEDMDLNEIFHPDISVASWKSTEVNFCTNDPENVGGYKEWVKETHEEALELVRQYRAEQIAQSSESK